MDTIRRGSTHRVAAFPVATEDGLWRRIFHSLLRGGWTQWPIQVLYRVRVYGGAEVDEPHMR